MFTQRRNAETVAPPNVANLFVVNTWTGDGTSSKSLTAPGLSGGGLVWTHARSASQSPDLYASPDGTTIYRGTFDATLALNASGDMTMSGSGYAFTSSRNNVNTRTYVGWSFGRSSRFCDVVTYTGDGSASQAINHSLGIKPGLFFVVDRTGTNLNWYYYERVNGAGTRHQHNSLAPVSDATIWANTEPSSSQFFVGNSTNSNTAARGYMAVLFAHDVATDGVIQCATYTGNGSATGPTVTLGWQPQYVFFMAINSTSGTNPAVADSTRTAGFSGNEERAYAFLSNVADFGWSDALALTADGFQLKSVSVDINGSGVTYLAVCVRAP